MTRLGNIRSRERLDLAGAFRFLGAAPSDPDLELALKLLRESGVKEVSYDKQLVALAEANGSSGFTALDLVTAFYHGVPSLYAGPRAVKEGNE